MHRLLMLGCIALSALLLFARPALAQENYEIQVYLQFHGRLENA